LTIFDSVKINNPKSDNNPQLRWDTLKCVLRGSTNQFSSLKKKTLDTQQNFLEYKMQLLQNRLGHCFVNCRDGLLKGVLNPNFQPISVELKKN